ncbi:MAG: protein kinase [Anaerolineae bacterium]|nr:protein kinase [Anaerolineae bacterium]
MDDRSGTTIKGYDLQEQIGVGGFGAVYRAVQAAVGRDVAVKVILPRFANNPEFIRRFENEAQTIARLEHMHIAPLYDYWRDPGGAYLVMRYFRGGSLAGTLHGGAYSLQAAALLLDQIAGALAVAHRGGIIHRDLKPGNILLDEDSNAYLADFGIAKDIHTGASGLTGADAIVGSLDYISPEQARSEPITPRTDIYSLGVVLYEILTGEHPFPGLSSVERMYRHLNDPLPLIHPAENDVWGNINTVIQKATIKDPARRYGDVLSLAAAFREAAQLDRAALGDAVVEQLTRREQDILVRIIAGLSNREIAQELFVEVSTVKWYIYQIYRKLGVRSRMQCIVRARELNLVVDGESESDRLTITSDEASASLLPPPENPYKGLRPFQAADTRDFFGREKLIETLVSWMGESGEFARFLAVVGPSGSGKSSVVRAGLIPALWRGDLPGSEKWFIVDMLPGPHPLDELEIALMRIAADQASNLHEPLTRDQRGLLRASQLILPNDGSELVIVVDQFEEAFTLVEDEDSCQQFLDLLHNAVTAPRSRVRVVITLRADFYDKPLYYPEFGEMMRSRMETILPLSAEELQRAISKPAEQLGVTFEEGLVATMVSEIHYQPGALPLLQYALTELFDNRDGRRLTRRAYEQIGRTTGALARRAETIYAELDSVGQEAARQMFLRLVTLGEGAEDTRRRVPRAELLAVAPDTDMMDEVIDTYTAYRLLTLDHDPATRVPLVEVAHEAILREWQRLRNWLDASRHDIRQQRLLAAAAADWLAAGQDTSYMLHGSRLEQFATWAAETPIALTQTEREFLDTSLDWQRQQEESERERQAHELALAQRAAESARQAEVSQRRAANRLRYLVAGLLVFLVVAVALAVAAFYERNTAQREADVNHSLVLANEAANVRDTGQTDLALMVALEAVAIADPPQEAVRALRDVALGTGLRANLAGHTHAVQATTFSPDSVLSVSGSCAVLTAEEVCERGEIAIWDVSGDASQVAELDRMEAHDGWVTGLAFLPGTSTLLSAGGDGRVLRWDADPDSPTFGTQQEELAAFSAGIRSFAVNPDGTLFVLAFDGEATMVIVDTATGSTLHTLSGHTGLVNRLVFSPDGQFVLSASDDTTLILWEAASGEPVRTFAGHTAAVNNVVFSPTGDTILSRSADLTVDVWDVQSDAAIRSQRTLFGHGCLGFSPDSRLAYICEGSTIGTWDIAQWSEVDTVWATNTSHEFSLIVSPDGRYLLVGTDSGEMALLNAADQGIVHRYAAPGLVPGGGIAITPDGRQLLMGTYAPDTVIWDTTNHQIVRRLDAQGLGTNAIAISSDGRWAVISSSDFLGGTRDNALIVWDIESGEQVSQFEGLQYWPKFQTFMPDGRHILGGSFTVRPNWDEENIGEFALWEAATGEEVYRFDYHADVSCVDVTRDGSLALIGSAHGVGEISLWNVDMGSEEMGTAIWRRAIEPLPSSAMDCQFARDDQTYFLATNLGTVEQRDVLTDTLVRVFSGHEGWVLHLDVSSDGQQLLTAGRDGNIVLWDIASGEELRRYTGHTAGIWDVVFSPDGQYAYSSSFDQSVLQWRIADWPLQELLDWIASNRYMREFTCEERETYYVEPLCD